MLFGKKGAIMTIKIEHPSINPRQSELGNISASGSVNSSKIRESACSRIGSHLSDAKKKIDSVCNPTKTLREEVETARMKKLGTALHVQLTGIHRGVELPEGVLSEILYPLARSSFVEAAFKSDSEASLDRSSLGYRAAEQWIQSVADLAEKIERLSQKNGPVEVGTLDSIRHEMSVLMGPVNSYPIYEMLIDSDHPAVNFLQILSIKLIAADGEPILASHARRLGVPSENQSYPVGSLADAIGGKLKQFTPFLHNHDRTINRIWWGIHHPMRMLHTFQSDLSPMTYNPSRGNPSYLGPRFERTVGQESKTLQAYYGPAPTGDRVFEFGLLPAYRKFGLFEIYFNYQDTSHAPEKARIDEIRRIAAKPENKDCLKHVVMGFDAKVAHPNMKALIQSFKTVEEFIAGYSHFVLDGARDLKTGTGIEIAKDLLSDDQLKGIFSSAQEFFLKMGVQEKLSDPQQKKKDIAEMMVMDIDARIASAILYQAFEKAPTLQPNLDKDLATCYVSARCKQHIDRGAVQSNTLRIYYRMFEDDSPLSQTEFEEICGGILGRAPNVEHRNILFKRYKRFDSLMRLIGSHHAELAQSLRDYRDKYLQVS